MFGAPGVRNEEFEGKRLAGGGDGLREMSSLTTAFEALEVGEAGKDPVERFVILEEDSNFLTCDS
jgi:hypothetical protein